MFDYLIVGAGFAGSVLAERLASQDDARVLIVDDENAGVVLTGQTLGQDTPRKPSADNQVVEH